MVFFSIYCFVKDVFTKQIHLNAHILYVKKVCLAVLCEVIHVLVC